MYDWCQGPIIGATTPTTSVGDPITKDTISNIGVVGPKTEVVIPTASVRNLVDKDAIPTTGAGGPIIVEMALVAIRSSKPLGPVAPVVEPPLLVLCLKILLVISNT